MIRSKGIIADNSSPIRSLNYQTFIIF